MTGAKIHRQNAKSAKDRQEEKTCSYLGGSWRSWRHGGESSLVSPCHSPLACWSSADTDFPPGHSVRERLDRARPRGARWPEAIHIFAFARLTSHCPDKSGSGRGDGERSMRSWDGCRYCCAFLSVRVVLNEPGALVHGFSWTVEHVNGKVSIDLFAGSVHSFKLFPHHFGATRMHDLLNTTGIGTQILNLRVPRLG